MDKMIKTKDVIIALKKVKKANKYSNKTIYEMVKAKDFSTHISLT